MGEVLYRPLIEDMTWSYSRITCFEECRYKWFLRYIHGSDDRPMFYASYGSFMHRLIEMCCRGEITPDEAKMHFLTGFKSEVGGDRPSEKIVQNYIAKGLEYLSSFKPFPYDMIDVEKPVEFNIDGIKFVGVIDYLGEKDGEYYIVDNKSRDLKPRSNRKKPTKKDEELDEMLRQLYLYSYAVKNEYGKFPKGLCFNCFKNDVFIEEQFDESQFEQTVEWAKKCVNDIINADETGFYPNIEFFACRYLCGVQDDCCFVGN